MNVMYYKRDVAFKNRKDAVNILTTEINSTRDFVVERNINLDKLIKLNYALEKKYYKLKLKENSKKSIKLLDIYKYTNIAIDICQLYDTESTDFFKDLKIDKDFVNSFIDYQINLEKRQNSWKDKYWHGKYKTYLWSNVDEDDKKRGYNNCK